MLPESPLSLPECSGGRSRQIFTLAVQLVAVNPCGIHVLAVAYQHFQLAVGQHAGLDTDERMPHLIQRNLWLNSVILLVLLPALE